MQNNELYSLEAEVELLAMLIQDKNRLDNIHYIKSDYFYYEPHGIIYNTIKNLINQQKTPDIITINNILYNNEWYQQIGEKMYLTKIQQTISFSTAKSCAYMIYSLYKKRKIIEVSQNIIEQASQSDVLSIDNIVSEAENQIHIINQNSHKIQELFLPELINDVLNRLNIARKSDQKITGISSGYEKIDDLLCGFQNGDLIVIAARVSQGKTALALNLAYNMIINNISTGFFSLEMSADSITNRLIALHTDNNSMSLRTGRYIGGSLHGEKISDYDFEKIFNKTKEIDNCPFYINHNPVLNIQELYAQTRQWIKKHNIKILIVDYIQIVKAINKSNKNAMRYIEIGEITNGLKNIARDFNIPVIALAQVNRDAEKGDNKKPKLADLSESSSIEKDADVVMFLYREAYYLEREKPEESQPIRGEKESIDNFNNRMNKYSEWKNKFNMVKNKAEIIIAKNRNGAIGSCELHFEPSSTKFSNVAKLLTITKEIKHLERSDWDKLEDNSQF